MGLQAALGLGVKEVEVYGDSALIISQVQNKWKIKEERLMPYHQCLQKWASKFSKIQYQYVLRMQNQIADVLATMASMMDGPKEDEARPIMLEQKKEPTYCMTIEEDEEKNREGEWYSDILQYLKDGTYPKPADKNDQLTIRRLSINYIIYGEKLYRRSYDGIHLLCVIVKEAQQIMEEAILPIEMGVHSLRTILESEIFEADWLQSRCDRLCMLDEKKLKALYHIQGYQKRLRKAFDKKVRTRDLKLRDLVLKEI
ncbi:uncharacterized protein LOC126698589 [Quercus robur]|uniref:uncharacterized protein LOC126698589 n=1 Tax=Quercus robur TaxID=38942 RepID=UPI0021611205|nr:uncharacterized protein LOC126698589 [Quercus robur]